MLIYGYFYLSNLNMILQATQVYFSNSCEVSINTEIEYLRYKMNHLNLNRFRPLFLNHKSVFLPWHPRLKGIEE